MVFNKYFTATTFEPLPYGGALAQNNFMEGPGKATIKKCSLSQANSQVWKYKENQTIRYAVCMSDPNSLNFVHVTVCFSWSKLCEELLLSVSIDITIDELAK